MFTFKGKVYPLKTQNSKVVAMASITFGEDEEDLFLVTGIKIVEGPKGYFISFPQYKNSEDEYKDLCFPLTKTFREEIQEYLIEMYEHEISKSKNESKKGRARK